MSKLKKPFCNAWNEGKENQSLVNNTNESALKWSKCACHQLPFEPMNTFIVALGTESISGLGDIWFKWWGGEEGVRGTILPVLLSVMIYMSVWLCVHMHVCYAVWIPKLVARAWILQVFQSFLVKHCYQCNNFQYPHLVYCLQNIRKGQIVWARPKWRIPTKKEKVSINITRAINLLLLSLSHNSLALSWII